MKHIYSFFSKLNNGLWSKNGYVYCFILILFSVVINSYFDPFGGITLDAPWYLKLSKSLANNEGFNTLSPDYIYYEDKHYCYLWPPLYPICIAAISKLTTLPVWLNYKIVNLLFILFTFYKIQNHFKLNSLLYLLPFFMAYIIEMNYQCWSELPLVCLLTIYFIELTKLEKQDKISNSSILSLFVLNLLMVFTRYQAVIVIVSLLIYIYKYYKLKQTSNLKKILTYTIALLIIEFSFIYFNFYQHNKIVYAVSLSYTQIKDIIASIFIQLFKQINFLFCDSITAWWLFPASLLMGWIGFKKLKLKDALKSFNYNLRFDILAIAIVGIIYLALPILMRGSNAVGIAHSRFYTVFFFCIIWGILLMVKPETITNVRPFITGFIFLSISINVIGKNIYINKILNQELFSDRLSKLENKYKNIPEGAILAFSDKWAEFLRPDLYTVSPYENVMGSLSLPMNEFLTKLKEQNKTIYIEIIKDHRMNRYDSTVKNYMLSHQNEDFIILKPAGLLP
ncbi:MAG: hypothetical protein HYZ42_16115 [Bacteroidetes bacterium]|nr:hypothetical protein [Bacteroidota bacterium]